MEPHENQGYQLAAWRIGGDGNQYRFPLQFPSSARWWTTTVLGWQPFASFHGLIQVLGSYSFEPPGLFYPPLVKTFKFIRGYHSAASQIRFETLPLRTIHSIVLYTPPFVSRTPSLSSSSHLRGLGPQPWTMRAWRCPSNSYDLLS